MRGDGFGLGLHRVGAVRFADFFAKWQRVVAWWRNAGRSERLAAGLFFWATALVWAQPLPGGPRLPFFLLLGFAMGAWWHARGDLWRPPAAKGTAGSLLVFALVLVLSVIGAPQPAIGWSYALGMSGFAVASAALVWAARRLPRPSFWLGWGVRAGFLFLLGDAWLQWLVGRDLFGVPYRASYFEGRLLGPFADTLKLPVLLALLFPVAVWPWRDRMRVALPLLLATGWVVLLSGARSALVLLMLAALPVVWRWPRRVRVGLLGVVVLGVFAAVVVSPAWQKRIENSVDGFVALRQAKESAATEEGLNRILSQRWELWRNATRMGAANPFFGVGTKQFRYVYADYADEGDLYLHADPYHAHHLYLALWAELGGAGLLWFFVIAGSMFVAFRRASPEARARAAPWAAALAAYAFPVQSQPVLLNVWWFPVIWLCWIAFWVALTESDRAEQSQQNGQGEPPIVSESLFR